MEALDSPTKVVPSSGNGDGGQESTLSEEENTLFDTFASPAHHSEEDCVISDHILDDFMADLGTRNLGEYPNQPKHPAQVSLTEYNNHPFDLVRIPEHDSLSLDETRTFSAHEPSPFTSTDIGVPANAVSSNIKTMRTDPTGPTPNSSTATSHLQVDRLPFQQQLNGEEQARRERASTFATTSPPFHTRQRGFEAAQSKEWGYPPKDRSQQAACQCLQSILGLLEELENRASTTDAYTMDSALAYHKEALNHCIHMVRCSACTARSDYMMLLGVVSDKLITSYEQIINENTESAQKGVESNERGSGIASSSSPSSGVGGGAGEAREKLARVVSLGYYQIDGPTEWEYVMRVLILLQVRQVFDLLARMQHIAEETLRGPQVSATRMREQRLKTIAEKFKRFGPLGSRLGPSKCYF